MTARWCPRGQHAKPETEFRTTTTGGRLARDCITCEKLAAEAIRERVRKGAAAKEGAGSFRTDRVDIDAIHFTRGAVAPHLRRKA